jgi:hypothetical protein
MTNYEQLQIDGVQVVDIQRLHEQTDYTRIQQTAQQLSQLLSNYVNTHNGDLSIRVTRGIEGSERFIRVEI